MTFNSDKRKKALGIINSWDEDRLSGLSLYLRCEIDIEIPDKSLDYLRAFIQIGVEDRDHDASWFAENFYELFGCNYE